MRRGDGPLRPGVVLPAFWWTLAVVHLMPLVRLALAGDAAPASRPMLLLVLGLVIAFCGVAGIVALRAATLRRQTHALLAFLLAASIVHHEAVGAAAPAVLAPVAAVGVWELATAVPAARRRLGHLRRWLQISAIRVIDLHRPAGLASGTGRRSAGVDLRIGPAARGPPARLA